VRDGTVSPVKFWSVWWRNDVVLPDRPNPITTQSQRITVSGLGRHVKPSSPRSDVHELCQWSSQTNLHPGSHCSTSPDITQPYKSITTTTTTTTIAITTTQVWLTQLWDAVRLGNISRRFNGARWSVPLSYSFWFPRLQHTMSLTFNGHLTNLCRVNASLTI